MIIYYLLWDQVVKKIYEKATIGPSINIQLVHVLSSVLPVELQIKKLTKGWNVVYDEQHHKVCEIVHIHSHLIHTCSTDEYVHTGMDKWHTEVYWGG